MGSATHCSRCDHSSHTPSLQQGPSIKLPRAPLPLPGPPFRRRTLSTCLFIHQWSDQSPCPSSLHTNLEGKHASCKLLIPCVEAAPTLTRGHTRVGSCSQGDTLTRGHTHMRHAHTGTQSQGDMLARGHAHAGTCSHRDMLTRGHTHRLTHCWLSRHYCRPSAEHSVVNRNNLSHKMMC